MTQENPQLNSKSSTLGQAIGRLFTCAVGVATIVACIASVILIPEVRRFIGLDDASPQLPTIASEVRPSLIPTSSPETKLEPTTTPSPVVVGNVFVQADNQLGERFTFPSMGNYRVTYHSGTYSTGPESKGGKQWRTVIHVYELPRGIEWGDHSQFREPIKQSYTIGCRADEQPTDESSQIACAQRTSFSDSFQEGEILIFVAVDDKNSYGDNSGTVKLIISLIP